MRRGIGRGSHERTEIAKVRVLTNASRVAEQLANGYAAVFGSHRWGQVWKCLCECRLERQAALLHQGADHRGGDGLPVRSEVHALSDLNRVGRAELSHASHDDLWVSVGPRDDHDEPWKGERRADAVDEGLRGPPRDARDARFFRALVCGSVELASGQQALAERG